MKTEYYNNNTLAARYVTTYDAWGNALSITDGSGNPVTSGIGINNPLRYRGYYYDTETNLYYLQSRYYSPELGRFISSDDVNYLGVSGTVLGYNLFSYCDNNSVNLTDSSGYAPINFVGAGIQIELSIGAGTGGMEIIWYFSSQVNVGTRNRRNPYIYICMGE